MRWIKRALWVILIVLWQPVRLMLYGLRMTAWFILTMLRGPVRILCGFITLAGLVGGMILTPVMMYIGQIEHIVEPPSLSYAMCIGLGFFMTVAGSLAMVFYDTLLFKLQPKDRDIIYY